MMGAVQEAPLKTMTRWMCAVLVLAVPALAPAAVNAPGPERLPADTWILVNWHGVAGANKVRATNPVMRLWSDPQFAAAREQIAGRIAGSIGKDSPSADDRAAIDDFLSVLENPLVLGVAGDPLAGGKEPVHMYVVLNRKGKEEAWNRLQQRQKPRANAETSSYTFRGVQIRKTVTTTAPRSPVDGDKAAVPPPSKISTSFEASLGDYELYSSGQALMESLITGLQDGKNAGDSLLKNAAYQRAQRFRAAGPLLEAFVKMPDLSKLPIPATPQLNTPAIIRELHPERLQGLWFSAGMGRDRMLVRAALIGDTTPGSLLDLIGGNVKEFQTLAAAPATESYGAFRLDLPALYATIMRAVKAGMPPDRGAAVGMMIDSMTMAQTGMRAAELLSLFSGEIGVATSGEERLHPGSLPALLMIPVTGGEQLLALLQNFAGPLFTSEEKLAGATVVKVDPAAAGAAMPAGAARKTEPFFLAVSSGMLMVSPDRAQLQAALSRDAAHAAAPPGSLAADAKFRSVRKRFPAQLNGISYTDFSRVRWETYAEALHQQIAKQRQQLLDRAADVEKGEGDKPPDPARAAQLRAQAETVGNFEPILASLLPLAGKYLKISAGGSWKAGDGVFFDSFVN